ncbi:MAG: F0F1 ATP synthase subunit B' [Neomegalonema sp.]|nr:F0F1 ATP synthase subunit B' [Neomegalonema sp.]
MAGEPHEAAASGGLPQLDFSTWPSQIFWLVVSFGALYFILSRLALPKIAETLQARQDQIAGDLDLAGEFEQKAKEAEEAYNAALASARAEARKIADKTQAEIKTQMDAAMAEADARIEARATESTTRIAAIRDDARAQATTVAEDIAGALIAKLGPAGGVDASAISGAVSTEIERRFGG